MSLAVDAGPVIVSDWWVDVSHEERDCEVGAPEGPGISDDGGGGHCDLECLDRKTPLRECISSQGFETLRLGAGEMIW